MTERNKSRAEAMAKGRRFYIGDACKACGFRKRYTSSRNCYTCRKQATLDLEDNTAGRAMSRNAAKSRQAAKRARDKAAAQSEAVTMLELALTPIFERIESHGNRKPESQ